MMPYQKKKLQTLLNHRVILYINTEANYLSFIDSNYTVFFYQQKLSSLKPEESNYLNIITVILQTTRLIEHISREKMNCIIIKNEQMLIAKKPHTPDYDERLKYPDGEY